MALAGRLSVLFPARPFSRILMRSLVQITILSVICCESFSDERISENAVEEVDAWARERASILGDDSEELKHVVGVFMQGVPESGFHQLALTETVKDEGDACARHELRYVPVRTLWGASISNASSVQDALENERTTLNCKTPFHLCARSVASQEAKSDWKHLGRNSILEVDRPCNSGELKHVRRRRQAEPPVAPPAALVSGLRVERSDKAPVMAADGTAGVMQERETTLRLFGTALADGLRVKFTSERLEAGASCQHSQTTFVFELSSVDAAGSSGLLTVVLPQLPSGASAFFMCVQPANGTGPYMHLGTAHHLSLSTYPPLLPVPLHVILLLMLLCLSGLFSGLNLGLMALNITELKLVLNTGTEAEKGWARTIIPVRNHGNYLLCTLLLGNVLVNSSLTILLDDLTSGIVAVIGSTLGIVIFGEIVPQALCSRHGLAVGAKTIYLTKLFMLITSPLSFPISLILDRVLGEEIGNTYNRDRLKELIKLNKDDMGLENEEQNMIVGALDLKAKTVGDVMTPLDDVYMLPYDAILDYHTISEIMEQGYSRIPVCEGDRSNIVAVMLAKDMAFVDPDDCTPIKTLCHFYQNPWSFVFDDVTLDVMLREFKEGNKGHMAFVQRVVTETVGDPYYELVGLVTLEDVIEEMIQAEIMDETDVLTDNRTKKRRGKKRLMPDPIAFAQPTNNQIHISPQLALATFQFLQTVEPFKNELICPSVLKKLLEQDVVRHIKLKDGNSKAFIYERSKPVDFFCMILEGRVDVTMGKENLSFESGPFSYFGTQALTMPGESDASPVLRGSVHSLDGSHRATFVPEYSVRAVTDVYYLRIRRGHYVAARKATLVAAQQRDPNPLTEQLVNDIADMGSRTDSLRDFHLNPSNTVSRAADSSATLVSAPAVLDGAAPPAGSDTEQSELSSLLSVPTTPSGRHVNFVEVRERQRSASHPADPDQRPPANGDAGDIDRSAIV